MSDKVSAYLKSPAFQLLVDQATADKCETMKQEAKDQAQTFEAAMNSKLEAAMNETTLLKSTVRIQGRRIHSLADAISLRQILNLNKRAFHKLRYPRDQDDPPELGKHTPPEIQAMLGWEQRPLQFLDLECVDEVYSNEPGSGRQKGNHAAHDLLLIEPQRDAVLRLASSAKYFIMRLLFRFIYRKTVGTAAEALLSYSEEERRATDLSLSPAAADAEAAAVVAEARIFRVHPEWRI